MKKVIIFLIVGVLVLALAGLHIIGYTYEQFSQEQQNSVLAYYQEFDKNIYTAKEDATNEALIKTAPLIDDFLELLPSDTINRFRNEHWKIIISSRKPLYIKDGEDMVGYNIGGNTHYGLRLIYVYLNDEVPEYLLSDFIHEFGHFEDWEKGKLSSSNEFLELFNEHKYYSPGDEFGDTKYHLSSEKEFFACCYKDYYLHKQKFAGEAPQLYGYMDDIINNGNSNFISFYLRIFRG